MNKMFFKLILFFALASISTASFAQSVSGKKVEEHKAVKDFMMKAIQQEKANNNTATVLRKKDNNSESMLKTQQQAQRKSYFMNGNKISTDIFNYGGIGPGYGLLRGVNNFVWHNLSYVFQFCPIVGASVPDANNPSKRIHIISDGLHDYETSSYHLQELSPNGDTLWQWQPLEGYEDPTQQHMASNPAPDLDGDGKPDSWPRSWYNPDLGKYVWPGYLSQDANNADLEVFWGMDDRDNAEFQYYPFPSDSSRRGLGVQVEGRAFQWSNALAENTIFFVYTITNTSEKDIDSVFFGVYGDPDVGSGSPENTDDNGFFVPPYSTSSVNVDKIPPYARSMVYFFDEDMTGPQGLKLGYLGCKFLESPGNPNNGIDDDGDGMIDERQDDGIDNDHDWSAFSDDLGIDGIPNTNDLGEGDGVPTAGIKLADGSLDPLHPGEPNFEFTDLDESDQIGLTSFNSWTWSTDKISNDESMWNRSIPRNFGAIQQNADIVFIYGSGYISLKKGETKRISMALLCGEDLDDLLTSAETVQTIYNQNYQFYKPPVLPTVTAVPGDKKVTLFWDDKAEQSIDPISGKDFEGYVIYRSTDPSFNDIQQITDGKGAGFLNDPLKDYKGNDAKFDNDKMDEPYTDLNSNAKYDIGEPYKDYNNDGSWTANIPDIWIGYHPVPYQGRGIQYYLGNNSGLVHSYVDSNNVINGQTYYYAVVAYDHGDSTEIPPTETTKKITVDPITAQLKFDPNTVKVIPGRTASGFNSASVSDIPAEHTGKGTGKVGLKILDNMQVLDNGKYKVVFNDSIEYRGKNIARLNYSVIKETPVEENFKAFDDKFSKLEYSNIANDSSLVVKGSDGTVYAEGADYIVDYERGSVRRTATSSMPNQENFSITYHYFPVYKSTRLQGEDGNPVFDGLELRVVNETVLEIDSSRTEWVEGNTNYTHFIQKGSIGTGAKYPADYEISFSDTYVDSAFFLVTGGLKKFPVKFKVKDLTENIPILAFVNEPVKKDTAWNSGDEIILFKPGSTGKPDETTWGIVFSKPKDSTLTPVPPGNGDVFVLATKRPFTSADKITFETEGVKYSQEMAKTGLKNVYVVPNPYVGVNEIEPTTKLPGQVRGERRIYFENLPPKCSIRIYTLSGEYVQTIDHDTNLENGKEYWNLLNKDGFSVAYGIYFAHIDAPGVGEKLIKFALIK